MQHPALHRMPLVQRNTLLDLRPRFTWQGARALQLVQTVEYLVQHVCVHGDGVGGGRYVCVLVLGFHAALELGVGTTRLLVVTRTRRGRRHGGARHRAAVHAMAGLVRLSVIPRADATDILSCAAQHLREVRIPFAADRFWTSVRHCTFLSFVAVYKR